MGLEHGPAAAEGLAGAQRPVGPTAPRPSAQIRIAGLILAAGRATRFGSVKLLAPLESRPLLEHVLEAAREAGLAEVVVVLGEAAARMRAAVAWRGERIVVNDHPERGLSSSLQMGVAAVDEAVDGVVILLGDQPRVRADVIRALIDAPMAKGESIAVPRYAGGGGPNPVLLLRAAWPLVADATGDRGIGPLLAGHAELVRVVNVEGSNPDVDTPSDLAALGRR